MLTRLLILALCPLIFSLSLPQQNKGVWDVSNFRSLVTFGDSYTDENRYQYYVDHNSTFPPPGTLLPEAFQGLFAGGRVWPRYAVQYTGATIQGQWTPQMTLYNYAVSGAICSSGITPRHGFPGVLEYEVPAYLADKDSIRNGTNEPYFSPILTPGSAVYALWVGTNDLGINTFLTDSQIPGKVLSDYTDCIYTVFDRLYESGSRTFVLFNTAPLQLTPLYANYSIGGLSHSRYWPSPPANKTQIAETMHEYTTSVNNVFKYQTPFELVIANRYPDADFALFNVWQLLSDLYDDPERYFNGSGPINITGYEHQSNDNASIFYNLDNGSNPDAFMWWDALHPSEQTARQIARAFIEVLNGSSAYATYYRKPAMCTFAGK